MSYIDDELKKAVDGGHLRDEDVRDVKNALHEFEKTSGVKRIASDFVIDLVETAFVNGYTSGRADEEELGLSEQETE